MSGHVHAYKRTKPVVNYKVCASAASAQAASSMLSQ
jgi:acyl-CoA synthetase (NDP forming)